MGKTTKQNIMKEGDKNSEGKIEKPTSVNEIIFGPNAFSGISSESKSRANDYNNRFSNKKNIRKILLQFRKRGGKSVMTYYNADAVSVLKSFKTISNAPLNVYSIVPNAAQYMRDINKYGMIGMGIRRVLKLGLVNLIKIGLIGMKNAKGVLKKNFKTILSLMLHIELVEFKKLRPRVIFLHHQMTDMLLANNNRELLSYYADFIREKYNAEPGLYTKNLALLINRLNEWNIDIRAITCAVNPKGFMMKPSKSECEKALQDNIQDKDQRYTIFADDVFAGNTIPKGEAVRYLSKFNINKIVAEIGSKEGIEEVFEAIA